MDAVLVVDKPIGPTSFDVVRKVRRAARSKRSARVATSALGSTCRESIARSSRFTSRYVTSTSVAPSAGYSSTCRRVA